jgi:hypothetical protein
MRNVGVGLTLLFASWAAAAQACTLDLNVSAADCQGVVGYDGGSTPLVASGLGVDSITWTDTPRNPNQELNLTGGQLDFTTGAFRGTAGGTGWNFAKGGSVSVTGAIPSLGIAAGTVLLEGSFTGTTTVRPQDASALNVLGATSLHVVNPQLASYLGLSTGSTIASRVSDIFHAQGTPGASFVSDCSTSDQQVTVPEPGMLQLYASTLLGLTAWGRRRLRAGRPG